MAESSSAVPSTLTAANSRYDVFINHHGLDLKTTFVGNLYQRLHLIGLRVFMDKLGLQGGDYLTLQIEPAIRSASVHVAIFSPGYADSTWFLNVLVQMLDSKAPIIPVFYHVKPAELRWTRGKKRSYAEALEKHERKMEIDPQTREEKLRYDSNRIENWRNVLSKVADISGLALESFNGDEGRLVDQVVVRVLKMVKKPALDVSKYPSALDVSKYHQSVMKVSKRRSAVKVSKYPSALDDKVKDFEESVLLSQQQRGKPRIFGIVGLAGVGKTTLAKEFFNRKNSEYHKSCFLCDVSDNAGLISLQKMLIKSLTGSDISVNSVDEGTWMLRTIPSFTNALVIIDDVDHEDQVCALLPYQTVPVRHSDSLILITSRNKDVLISSGVEESSIYTLTGLTPQHSLELFCLHSFNRPHPPPEYESLVAKFLEACAGLPLFLKVFGTLLHEKNASYWEHQLNMLGRILPSQIKQRLQIIYDSLDREEKDMFLDIACFFIGEDRDMAVKIWNNGLCGFQNIQDRCLIEVDSENKIQMYHHFRDLGREIAKASGLPRRLWRWTENDNDDLLQQSSVTAVRGIRLVPSDDASEAIHMWMSQLLNALDGISMRELQLLDTEDVLLERILRNVQFSNLIWLRWNKCPYSALPSFISRNNLRVLQVQGSNLLTLWEKESEAPVLLRALEIGGPLLIIPKSIGKLKHLERIVIGSINGNNPLVLLTKLPEEFCLLQSLKALVLRGCSKMKTLPECFGNLTNLQQIQLIQCSVLERLPDSFGNLTNLQQIQLIQCSVLKRLPDSFGNLTNLQQIQLIECSALKRLPDSFGHLTNLQQIQHNLRSLDLRGCSSLQILPDSVGKLRNLTSLDLRKCCALQKLPDSVGNLQNLSVLDLKGCSSLQMLPDSVGNLHDLSALDLKGCSILQMLPDSVGNLENLLRLDLRGCSSLRMLPDSVGNLQDLSALYLEGCSILQMLPDSVGNLRNLRSLDLKGCSSLLMLRDSVGNLRNLRSLDLKGCSSLQMLPDSVGNLQDLSALYLEGCSSLQMLPDSVGKLRNLPSLDLRGCSSLQLLPDSVESLWNLHSIYLGGCSNLQMLPNHFGKLTGLEYIDLSRCSELPMLPNSFRTLKNLRHIDLSRCSNLGMLPYSFGNLRNLNHINLSYCSNLQMLPNSLENLKYLRSMNLSRCSNLHTLPNSFGNLRNLQHIDLSWCSNLQMLPNSFGNLTNLQHIDLNGCSNLPILPNSFGNLIQLKHLCLRKCYDLIISSETLGQIRTLEWLKISGCYGIEVLPPQITHQRFLRELYLFCPFLKELSSAIGELSHLEILHLSSSCLEQLEIGSLVSLEELRACKCVTLKSIQGLAKLTRLRRLEVSNCSELKELPDVEHLMSVEELSASECPKLQWGSGVLEQLDRQLKKCVIR